MRKATRGMTPEPPSSRSATNGTRRYVHFKGPGLTLHLGDARPGRAEVALSAVAGLLP